MSITLESLKALAARAGNNVINSQINLLAAGVDAMATEDVSERVRMINVHTGASASAGIIQDAGSYPSHVDFSTAQLMARPVSFAGFEAIGIDAADEIKGGNDAINLVEERLGALGQTLAFDLGRCLFNPKLANVEANASIGGSSTATVYVDDIAAFRVGMKIDWYDSTPTTLQGTGVVSSVTRDGDGTGSIGLASIKDSSGTAKTSGTISQNHTFYVLGHVAQAAAAQGFVGLEDMAGTGTLYGTAASSLGWEGKTVTVSGLLTSEHVGSLLSDVRRAGHPADVLFISEAAMRVYQNDLSDRRQFMAGDVLDQYGKAKKNNIRGECEGVPMVVDQSCPETKIFAVNKKACKLGVWKKFGPLGGDKHGITVSETNHYYVLKVHGRYQNLCLQRPGVGLLKSFSLQ